MAGSGGLDFFPLWSDTHCVRFLLLHAATQVTGASRLKNVDPRVRVGLPNKLLLLPNINSVAQCISRIILPPIPVRKKIKLGRCSSTAPTKSKVYWNSFNIAGCFSTFYLITIGNNIYIYIHILMVNSILWINYGRYPYKLYIQLLYLLPTYIIWCFYSTFVYRNVCILLYMFMYVPFICIYCFAGTWFLRQAL